MVSLSRLREIKDLRTVWPHEALDFTPWLSQDDNITLLADAVGLDITVDETESSVGNFNVDIFATEMGTDRRIIIENQLEDTDHDHLGKLITYASGKSADIIIWVVKHAREEHKAAIEWLNNHTDENIGFFLCEIKLYRIGQSEPAVKFEVLEKPNDWVKEIKKNEFSSETQQRRYEYWVAFQDRAFQDPEFSREFKRRKPSTDHWLDYSIGSSECYISVTQVRNKKQLTVGLYIPNNKDLYDSLEFHQEDINQEAGIPLSWHKLEGRKASKILAVREDVNFEDQDQCPRQFDWLMDTMLRMKAAFKKYI